MCSGAQVPMQNTCPGAPSVLLHTLGVSRLGAVSCSPKALEQFPQVARQPVAGKEGRSALGGKKELPPSCGKPYQACYGSRLEPKWHACRREPVLLGGLARALPCRVP